MYACMIFWTVFGALGVAIATGLFYFFTAL